MFCGFSSLFSLMPLTSMIKVRNEKGTGAEMCPAILSGIVTMGKRRSAIGYFLSVQ